MNRTQTTKNIFETVRHAYDCDFYRFGEFFIPPDPPVVDSDMIKFQDQITEIVTRRDLAMSKLIDEYLRDNKAKNRYFFAVGLSNVTCFQ